MGEPRYRTNETIHFTWLCKREGRESPSRTGIDLAALLINRSALALSILQSPVRLGLDCDLVDRRTPVALAGAAA